jgi:Ca2+-binding RTX toxin-like protein
VRVASTGSVFSHFDDGIEIRAANMTVRNEGTVFGDFSGINLTGPEGVMSRILNTGTIMGNDNGIRITTATVTIVNSGTIIGESSGIFAGGGATVLINNTGEITGGLNLSGGHDVYNGQSGHIDGKIQTFDGNDTVNAGVDNDFIEGMVGNDVLRGNGGNDTLVGGEGNDTLSGGLGLDRFQFTKALSGTLNVDRITDYSVAQDTIALSKTIFAALGGNVGTFITAAEFWKSTAGVAHDANDRIIYETDTGKLVYDSNGSTAGGAIHFATLAPNLAINQLDFLII